MVVAFTRAGSPIEDTDLKNEAQGNPSSNNSDEFFYPGRETWMAERDSSAIRRRTFQLALASHYGHARIARIAEDEGIRILAEVVARQRYSQCRVLASLAFATGTHLPAATDDARDAQAVWIRAGHELLNHDYQGFRDQLTYAEALLEDALIEAAGTFGREPAAQQLLDFSLSVYGSRLRWEELCGRCGEPPLSNF